MPNRVLRDWTDSKTVAQLDAKGERFFVRLMMKADDFGLCTADAELLRASLFPRLLGEVREADITRWIAACVKAGLIRLYTVAGKDYLEIKNFGQRLDKARPKHPLPPPEESGNDAREVGNEFPEPGNEFPAESESETETESETESKRGSVPARVLEMPFSDGFAPAWQDWKDYKQGEHKFRYKTPQSEQAALNSLVKLSGGDESVAREIILQSMANGWQGFFELKTSHNAATTKPKPAAPGRDSIFNPYSENFVLRR